ncbi:MAG: hypothetical protein JXB47_03105 [Anaerolineae bacterium]|nr:hypothetical protein [Anaerolineae bacterium]
MNPTAIHRAGRRAPGDPQTGDHVVAVRAIGDIAAGTTGKVLAYRIDVLSPDAIVYTVKFHRHRMTGVGPDDIALQDEDGKGVTPDADLQARMDAFDRCTELPPWTLGPAPESEAGS